MAPPHKLVVIDHCIPPGYYSHPSGHGGPAGPAAAAPAPAFVDLLNELIYTDLLNFFTLTEWTYVDFIKALMQIYLKANFFACPYLTDPV